MVQLEVVPAALANGGCRQNDWPADVVRVPVAQSEQATADLDACQPHSVSNPFGTASTLSRKVRCPPW